MNCQVGNDEKIAIHLETELKRLADLTAKFFQDIPEIGDCQRELAEWREVMKKIDEEQEKKKKIFVERQLFTQEFHSQAVKDYQILDETTKITSAMTPGKRNPLTNVNPFSRADASPFLPPSLSQFGSGQKRRQKLILSSANMPEIQFADENVKPKPKVEEKVTAGMTKCKEIRPVSGDEFNAVPKYMKGSLTLDRVNGVVQKLNVSIGTKYNLISLADQKGGQRGLGKVEKDRLIAYREQENKETRGLAFVCESDFKAQMNPREMLQLKQVLPILRHCGRLREVRGQNLLRYVVLPH